MFSTEKIVITLTLFFILISSINVASAYNDSTDSNSFNTNNNNNNITIINNTPNNITNTSNTNENITNEIISNINNSTYNTYNIESNTIKYTPYIKITSYGSPKSLSVPSIILASIYVKNYVNKYGKLPDYITISRYNFTMAEFLYLITKTSSNLYKKNKKNIVPLYNIKNPSNPYGTNFNKYISKKTYYNQAIAILNYIKKNKKTPKFASFGTQTGKGKVKAKVKYQSLILAYVNILSSYSKNRKLPQWIKIISKKTSVLNRNMPSYNHLFNQNDVISASNRLKSSIDTNHNLPLTVLIGGRKVNTIEFLYLMAKTIINLDKDANNRHSSKVTKIRLNNPENKGGNSVTGTITKIRYVALANKTLNYLKNNKKAPKYLNGIFGIIETSIKKVPYPTLVYLFADILNQSKAYNILNNNNNNNYNEYNTYNHYSNNHINNNYSKNSSYLIESIYVNINSGKIFILNKRVNPKYTGNGIAIYLKSVKNAPKNDAKIKALAKSLTKGIKNPFKKAEVIYNYVRNYIDYGYYYNTKYGARKTLNKKLGNCVDESHLLIAMYRSIGIPAKYVHGNCYFITKKRNIGHVWVQVKVGKYWLVADPTSYDNSLGYINNWKTSSYHLYNKYSQLPF
ncbi:MAG: transglutaminase-like domain-containing protein [Methanobacteriaceae archaeon]